MIYTPREKTKLTNFYMDLLTRHGSYSPKALSWNNEFTQFTRFKVLSEIGNLSDKSILDVGCGFGDLYFFLAQKFKNFSYLGIDIIPEMIGQAKIKYPKAKFKVSDLDGIRSGRFDYVLASGILSLKILNYRKRYFREIEKMFSACRAGVAFNMLNYEGHPDNETFIAWKKEEVRDFCRILTSKVKLIDDYLPQDFTVYLYRR